MEITLKKIYTNEKFSEETNCFKADIYLNGKKVGYAENDGRGGNTTYYGIEHHWSEDIKRMEEYCKTLPPIVYTKEKHGMDFTIDMTLEHHIDNIISDYLNEKAEKQLAKNFDKGICYGSTYSYSTITFNVGKKKITITEMLKTTKGTQMLIDTCNDKIKEGKKILNTNLPFLKKQLCQI